MAMSRSRGAPVPLGDKRPQTVRTATRSTGAVHHSAGRHSAKLMAMFGSNFPATPNTLSKSRYKTLRTGSMKEKLPARPTRGLGLAPLMVPRPPGGRRVLGPVRGRDARPRRHSGGVIRDSSGTRELNCCDAFHGYLDGVGVGIGCRMGLGSSSVGAVIVATLSRRPLTANPPTARRGLRNAQAGEFSGGVLATAAGHKPATAGSLCKPGRHLVATPNPSILTGLPVEVTTIWMVVVRGAANDAIGMTCFA